MVGKLHSTKPGFAARRPVSCLSISTSEITAPTLQLRRRQTDLRCY